MLLMLATSMALASCGSKKAAARPDELYAPVAAKPVNKAKQPEEPAHDPTRRLMAEARSWLGVPYRYGGNDRSGIDCSGLVLKVYLDAVGIALPRVSRQQCEYCTPIAMADAVKGDLLFFATTKGSSAVSHVGIYIGRGRMIHASSSGGVVISDLSLPFFRRTFAGAGRVERYHAMLAKQPQPQQSPQPQQPAFTLEPVAALPSKKQAQASESLNDIIQQKIDSIASTPYNQ